MEYLKGHPEISNILAEGFAKIYHEKPKFPVTFLANFLKNQTQLKDEKNSMIRRLINNQTLSSEIKK
jgi:hypothetical protein